MSNQEENQIEERPKKKKSPGLKMRRGPLIAAIAVLAVVLAILAFRMVRSGGEASVGRAVPRVEGTTGGAPVPGAPAAGMPADLSLPPEMLSRIRIEYAEVTRQPLAEQLRTTGTVQPNAYRETPVMPLVGGRITSVRAELGQAISEGQILATIHSDELAEAQMKYLSVDANLQFHVTQAKRFEKLADIGAVSKQELEEVVSKLREHHAEHASLRERMLLYGLTEQEILALKSATQVRSEVPVHSPVSGIITARGINVGQVITMRDKLFDVTNLSTVWVIANVYEKDFGILRLGTVVTITTPSYPGRTFRGTISYVDPIVDAQTRTAKVRIEVPNPGQMLKLGMFVDAFVNTGSSVQALAVPKAAVQTVGSDQVVFVSGGEGRFQLRRVQFEEGDNGYYRVLSGLSEGEKVVTEGSFFLRAELARSR
ncbi:MAG: efflux RND transporter periplasmic adaptor subunit [Blastocatellales bacterium]